ncbi:MAG TPA: translation initiation factor IF-2 [Leptolyngbyaceae cyanobacterium M33_DOE_097]|uniref:Translation initiation factor IF-2 n=1 Tax=Oscillatoriales cyanobacterium SpSt-418 TaxID=2282169 RepID=A0A7C3PFF3_9CYAN|nr:translation initiation factor IF-2 [Leptolyngbyaceae cyanobacterium M33_DOE_097]
MSGGKVRIYDLSRELNLDNRDILAICEQQNIAVKSHSSTITDSEAERIRAAIHDKQSNSSASLKPAQSRVNVASGDAGKRNAQAAQKKQQILEVRTTKPIVRQPATPQPPAPVPPQEAPETAAARLNPPPPPVPKKPVAPARDHAPAPVAPTANASDAPPVPTEPVSNGAALPETPPDAPAEELVRPTPTAPVEVSKPAKLVKPPVKPVAPVASAPATPPPSKPSLTKPPILKKPSEVTGERLETRNRPERPSAPVKPSDNRPTPRPQTIVELRRPNKIAPPEPEVAAGADEETVEVELKARPKRLKPIAPVEAAAATETVQLHRPTLPRSKKKGRDDEEEETQDFPEKVAKLGVKGKRRVPNVDDEDEDFEIYLEDDDLDEDETDEDEEDAPTSMDLSLARPPKPKSTRPIQAKPVALAPKAKRASSSSRDRRDRREQDNKPQKPEFITLTRGVTVQELAGMLATPETEIIKTLFMEGIMATVTQTLDIETATRVAEKFEVLVETGEKESAARKITEMLDDADLDNLQRRPPVVTIMGHVDHGKTTLLDSIRNAKVAQGEAGGITQHIGAYHVDVPHNGDTQQIVFLDTPGHEAFTAMRARGARVTDIAILVVAADDGVRPQTIEAISHAKAAEVPIVVAINKIDKEEAQPDRVKQEMTEFGLVPEEWGGETIMVPVSAIKGENLDTLLEMILLVAEVEDLYANPDRRAKGTVIEAHLDKAKGPVATFLVQNGTLKVGDILVAGSVMGKVRALMDDRGNRVKQATPSFAVEVLGLSDVPAAGDEFQVYGDEKEARAIATARADEQRQSRLLQALSSRRVSLGTLSARAQEGDLKELNLVLKADVQGSVEAILGSLKQLPQSEVQVRVLFAAPGEISETDVDLAAASDAVIIGFNTTLAPGARQAADRLGVDVRDYTIIYNLLDEIRAAMEGLLEPELVEEALGQVEVRAVFPVGKGSVAGCYVQSGKIIRNSRIRVHRGKEKVFEGNLDSLKRMKDDVKEVNSGYECGIGVDNFNAWVEGDIIEVYRMIEKRRTLSNK